MLKLIFKKENSYYVKIYKIIFINLFNSVIFDKNMNMVKYNINFI